MPVILVLSFALTAAYLAFGMTVEVQKIITRVEQHQEADLFYAQASSRVLNLLEVVADASLSETEKLAIFQDPNWKLILSGQFFNPLLWMEWSDEQRLQAERGMQIDTSDKIFDQLNAVIPCLLNKKKIHYSLFDTCTQKTLDGSLAFFPESTGIDVNRASFNQLKWVVPELSSVQWDRLDNERKRKPFISLSDLNERVPEMLKVSPLPNGIKTQSRYAWLAFKGSIDHQFSWLIDLQTELDGSHVLMMKEE